MDVTLFLVSNRLPVTARRVGGVVRLVPSTGGLATGLASLQDELNAVWVGWPGNVTASERRRVGRLLVTRHGCRPVWLPPWLARRHYLGFSNGTVWPLFHSLPEHAVYSPSDWEAYRAVNRRFAAEVLSAARPEDPVWIHDYQLLLLPGLLRERRPGTKIGFFLHIPFPPYDILRLMPWHAEILRALLGADLIGFHTYDYAQAFLGSARRLFGLDNEVGQILVGDRVAQVDVFPMGIDVSRFEGALDRPEVRRELSGVRADFKETRLVFSLSRLDYTKGIPQELSAMESFLERFQEWRGRISLVLVVVPSREGVERYADLKQEIDQTVGRINSRFGQIGWTPIRYVYRSLSHEELLALYAAADVMLVMPLRDGMNLIAKEYVATRRDGKGMLVLSEMAGAAKELLEAMIVNPNHRDGIADAIHQALTMPAAEKEARNAAMRQRLRAYDVRRWAGSFLARLEETMARSKDLAVRRIVPSTEARIAEDYRRAARRLLLLDYDGTLAPIADTPDMASPLPELLDILHALAASPRNRVCLVSGRRREDLVRWFGPLDITLVAEHGAWVREPDLRSWTALLPLEDRWKERIRPVLQGFVERVPGSFSEEKDFSLAWHYRKADPASGFEAAKELVDALTNLTANLDLHVILGKRVVEVKPPGVSKGAFFVRHLAREPWQFVLAIGDDAMDESLFRSLPAEAYSIRVGLVASAARFNVASVPDVLRLLHGLVALEGHSAEGSGVPEAAASSTGR